MILRINTVVALYCMYTTTIAQKQEAPIVETDKGVLNGTYLQSRGGKTYAAFLGIPYANPPKRFQPSEPVNAWTGIRNASGYGAQCAQQITATRKFKGSEDCLFLNIYTPNLNMNGNLPVMVYIHGGSFLIGASDDYQEKFLMDKNIILVTLNYRLGALGFLNTGDGEVEANLGLKDQLLALKYVNSYIKNFGGDFERVTLFGESAGASCVHHHVLSPLSKGLFSKAIIQSGSALGWGIQPEPEQIAFKLGNALNCFPDKSNNNSKVLLDCLGKRTAEEIMLANITEWNTDPISPYRPTIEKKREKGQTFIADLPINILKSGNYNKMPIIFTMCRDEGLHINTVSILPFENYTGDINEDFLRVLPITLQYKYLGFTVDEQNKMSKEIKNFYFGANRIDNSTMSEMVDMFSDRLFFHAIHNSVELHAKHSDANTKIFNGLFTYEGKFTFASIYGYNEIKAVTHVDDMQYLFSGPMFNELDNSTQDIDYSKKLVKLWTAFASSDNDNINLAFEDKSWASTVYAKLQKEGIPWFTLNFKPEVLQNKYTKRMDFWENLISGVRPGDPKLGNIIK